MRRCISIFITASPAFRIREVFFVIQTGDSVVTDFGAEVAANQERKHKDLMLFEGEVRSKRTDFGTMTEQLWLDA